MIVVYTACFGGYDNLQPVTVDSDAQFVAFTDSDVAVAGWEMVQVKASGDPRRQARKEKTTPHLLFALADVWLWHDANVELLVSPELLVSEWLGYADLAAPLHPSRDCAYDEANACLRKGKDSGDVLNAQLRSYNDAGYPRHNGLAETRVVIRRNTEDVARFNAAWWREISTHSVRDQVSFNYAAWKTGVEWKPIKAWVPKHPWFNYQRHRGQTGGGLRYCGME